MISKQTRKIIDSLIEAQGRFAIWRVPGEKEPRFVAQTKGALPFFHHINNLNGRRGFVVAPFRVSPRQPIYLIEPDVFELPTTVGPWRGERPFRESPPITADEKARYAERFERFAKELREGTFEKLVLSRQMVIERPMGFSPAEAFAEAEARYSRSMTYLCHLPEIGTWIGATPEILLAGRLGEWQTVALAATRKLVNGEPATDWDDKDRREQGLVAQYLRQRLAERRVAFQEEGPVPTRAAEVCHLKSVFRFRLERRDRLGDLLDGLHPTPAVCGLPEEEAYRFILAEEGYERSYYSGFIGWMDPDGRTDLYVNLRCLWAEGERVALYAGGGLLKDSDLDEEWEETREKMETMRRLLPPTNERDY